MDPHRLRDELLRVAERVGVEVRVEAMASQATKAGGLCRVHGEPVIILDTDAALLDQNHALAASLCELDLEAVFMAPAARNAILRARTRGRMAAVGSPISDVAESASELEASESDDEPVILVHPHKPGVRDCD